MDVFPKRTKADTAIDIRSKHVEFRHIFLDQVYILDIPVHDRERPVRVNRFACRDDFVEQAVKIPGFFRLLFAFRQVLDLEAGRPLQPVVAFISERIHQNAWRVLEALNEFHKLFL